MKRFLTIAIALVAVAMAVKAQGWPANYGGVMLQGFYWDSYSEARWSNLENQASELSKYFDIIWVPNSSQPAGGPNEKKMGYTPSLWFNHNTVFGTEEQLRSMIATYKSKGTIIMADCVVNHKDGKNSWVYFPNESKNGYSITWDNVNYSAICRTDECNSNGYHTTGAADTGEDFDGARDLDHTNGTVQKNIKTYISFLMRDLGYGGLRYDMVKGFKAEYIKMYNQANGVQFSVGEYFDYNQSSVVNWINGTGRTSAAFDFPLKGAINDAFGNGNWGSLSNKGIAGDSNNNRYSVTFVDNHDTYRDHNKMSNGHNELAANAFILAMPGTPCIFLKHWQAYKGEIAKMIIARKAAGITNTSQITRQESVNGGYVIEVRGSKGSVRCISGYVTGLDDTGWKAVSTGNATNQNYAYYVSSNVNLDEIPDVPTPDPGTTIPPEATYVEGKTFCYFEAPASWSGSVNIWAWNDAVNFTGAEWPGEAMTKVTSLSNGSTLYRWVYNGSATDLPTGVVFNCDNGSTQTDDFSFTNGGFYTSTSMAGTITKENGGGGGGDELPSIAVAMPGKTYAYFEAPATWGSDVKAWAWNTTESFTGAEWPGVACEKVGSLPSGNSVWRWVYDGALTDLPTGIVFNCDGGVTQTDDFQFINGGYYNVSRYVATVDGEVGGGGDDPTPGSSLPSIATYVDGKIFAYFEAPTSWSSDVKAWAWNDAASFTGDAWPGADCERVGALTTGNVLYRWIYNGSESGEPTGIVFNCESGNTQTDDFQFVNGGYYNAFERVGVVTKESGIESIDATKAIINVTDGYVNVTGARSVAIYNLAGIRVASGNNARLAAGTYIVVADGHATKIAIR